MALRKVAKLMGVAFCMKNDIVNHVNFFGMLRSTFCLPLL
jgi:hypothetical protein